MVDFPFVNGLEACRSCFGLGIVTPHDPSLNQPVFSTRWVSHDAFDLSTNIAPENQWDTWYDVNI